MTYADTKGCAPNWVRVTIAGVDVYAMTSTGTSYKTGVTFTRAIQLPVGTHAYSFAANSGDAGAQKTTALMSVSPPSVTVTAPATPPPPEPTPKPTPRLTAVPTPIATPVPTVPPTPSATPSDGASASSAATSGGSSSGGTGPSSPGPVASQDQGQAPGPSASEAGGAAGFGKTDGMGSFPLLMGAWATATAGGLALFLLLAPRRRTANEQAVAVSDQGMATPEAQPAPLPRQPLQPSDLVPPDEVNMPRWLRPSVQAARQGRGSRSNTRRFDS